MNRLQRNEGTAPRTIPFPPSSDNGHIRSPVALFDQSRAAPVHVVACLPPDLLAYIRQALVPGYRLTTVPDWPSLRLTWEASHLGVLVVDPRMSGNEAPSLEWADGAAVVLYTAFIPDAIRRVVALAGALARTSVVVALRGHDDDPKQLRSMLDQVAVRALADRLATVLKPRLAEVPDEVRAALVCALTTPLRFHTVEELADVAGVSTPTLRRWTKRAGVASPKRTLMIGRVVHAYHHLRARSASVSSIAEQLGYDAARDLSRTVRRLLAMSPSDLRLLSEEELFSRLAACFVEAGEWE